MLRRLQAAGEAIGIVVVIFGRNYEKSSSVFDTVGVGTAQDAVLADTLDSAVGVFQYISCAAVQEAVVSPGGTVCQVRVFRQGRCEILSRRHPRLHPFPLHRRR